MIVSALAAGAFLAGAVAPALAAKGSAKAPTRFDGTWSVEVITESGSCDRAYRYGVIIQNGQARYAGGSDFTVSGRVQPSGAVRATISRGDAAAQVVGRLAAEGGGNGTWTTSGSTSCKGRWNAERRG
ncbi:large exoprotein involved in heme utilization or adhesion [Methylobacterium platani]